MQGAAGAQALEYPEKVGIQGGFVSGVTIGSANACMMFMYALVGGPLPVRLPNSQPRALTSSAKLL